LNDVDSGSLLSVLLFLIALSAFFSSAETSLMALNRYRLKHLLKKNHRGAKRAAQLLERPDRLLGIILIGNNLVNTFATILATLLAQRYYGDNGVLLAGIGLTLVILIFAEITPKTLAAVYSEKIAFPASFVLRPLLRLFYPAVWLVNTISNGLLYLFRVNPIKNNGDDHLSADELRTVVRESSKLISPRYRSMLLNILDLDGITAEDIMIPRGEMVGIDINKDLDILLKEISQSGFTRLPVYNNDINNVIGILHVKRLLHFMREGKMPEDKSCITDHMRPAYFVPEGTPLNIQLLHFQKEKRRMAIVVDEYGDVQGLVTLEDILEEIVGEFTTHIEDDIDEIHRQPDGSVLIDCTVTVREINRNLQWQLPTDGPKTLNGLITEKLGSIPTYNVCFEIGNYYFETMEIADNRVKTVRGFEQNKTRPLFH
jgi:Mg2+/Co2+ transporter CorB